MKKSPVISRFEFDQQAETLEREFRICLEAIKPIGISPSDTDVFDHLVPMDSKLVVSELRPIVKRHLGRIFPLKFVQKGGYESVNATIDHLMPQLREWCPAGDTANGTSSQSDVKPELAES